MTDQTPQPWEQRAFEIAEAREYTGSATRYERVWALAHDISALVAAHAADAARLHELTTEREKNLQTMKDLVRQVGELTEQAKRGWRCFHCGFMFTDPAEAREHFGEHSQSTPACLAARLQQQEQEIERLKADRYPWGEPMPQYAVLGCGAEAWVELTTSERNGEMRGTDMHHSGVVLSWRTFKTVMNVLRAMKVGDEADNAALRAQVETLTDEKIAEFQRYDIAAAERDRAETLLEEARGDLSTLRGQLAQQGWQPIETAPKDGTMVLLFPSRCWCEEDDRGEVGYWDHDFSEWGGIGPRAEDYDGPTHWMPLPAPPVLASPDTETK